MSETIPLKNIAISKHYRVSRSTITRWLQSTMEGKNNLQLATFGKKTYVVDNEHNKAELQRLASGGAIFRNKDVYREVDVKDKFYEIFDESNIIEIFNSLQIDRRIHQKFSYFGDGADFWYNKIQKKEEIGVLVMDAQLRILDFIVQYLIMAYPNKKFNLFDLNPVAYDLNKFLIENLQNKGIFGNYISLDPSQKLNSYSVKLLENVSLDKSKFSYQTFDTENESMRNVLSKYRNRDSINIVVGFFNSIGGYGDVQSYLMKIKKEIGKGDLILTQNLLNTLDARTKFNHVKKSVEIYTVIPRLLGISVDKCEIKHSYDEKSNYRNSYLYLDKDYLIKFREWDLNLYKGEAIKIQETALFNMSQFTSYFDNANFKVKSLYTDTDNTFVMGLFNLSDK